MADVVNESPAMNACDAVPVRDLSVRPTPCDRLSLICPAQPGVPASNAAAGGCKLSPRGASTVPAAPHALASPHAHASPDLQPAHCSLSPSALNAAPEICRLSLRGAHAVPVAPTTPAHAHATPELQLHRRSSLSNQSNLKLSDSIPTPNPVSYSRKASIQASLLYTSRKKEKEGRKCPLSKKKVSAPTKLTRGKQLLMAEFLQAKPNLDGRTSSLDCSCVDKSECGHAMA